MPKALWALAIGAFGIGTTEFIIAGLLPGIANEFKISVSSAGNMATTYALGVFIGAPLLMILGAKVEKKKMLLIAMGLFIIGNFLTTFSLNYPMALVGRAVTALCHGVFFGIGSILAADIVAPNKRTSAIAFMFSGLAVANLVGIPAGTWFSHMWSWRATFFVIMIIGVVSFITTLILVPKTKNHQPPSLKKELFAFADIHVLLAMGITILGPAAFFTSITYIAPMASNISGFSENGVTVLLLLFGFGLFIGNYIGGKLADKALMPLLYATLIGQAVVLFIFYLVVESQVATALCVFLMAAFGFATVSPIQRLVMDNATAAGAANLASAVNIGFFNLGNALGAWLGGLVIATGFGYAAPNWAGGCLSIGAFILAVLSSIISKKKKTENLS
ncbi:MFS transporter [Bartonella tamiae]|uniref:Multidrug resistance protein n=1 Tax=Bartonella tamiae Th239 TaxID=1094558 RepID=J0ZKQ0_9HYPH|nr:MFS transporter [Bartonella tamiae]EJF88913.1 multidrug resistance protein [Bartonella tamiae Th239]EJF94837.1 multidrug resistance protein [Bartonella tamiae Th307]